MPTDAVQEFMVSLLDRKPHGRYGARMENPGEGLPYQHLDRLEKVGYGDPSESRRRLTPKHDTSFFAPGQSDVIEAYDALVSGDREAFMSAPEDARVLAARMARRNERYDEPPGWVDVAARLTGQEPPGPSYGDPGSRRFIWNEPLDADYEGDITESRFPMRDQPSPLWGGVSERFFGYRNPGRGYVPPSQYGDFTAPLSDRPGLRPVPDSPFLQHATRASTLAGEAEMERGGETPLAPEQAIEVLRSLGFTLDMGDD